MAEYRRFVAYVYEYQKGRKGSGCGFIRVEAWEKRCRMEVHIKCPGLVPGALCSIYGFTRSRGRMEGWLFGTCRTAEGRADCTVETERSRLGGQDVMLEQLGGMIVTMDNGGFFGTEWDDQPIHPETFRVFPAENTLPEEDRQDKSMEEKTAPPAEKKDEDKTGEGETVLSPEEEPDAGEAELKAQSVEETEATEEAEDTEEDTEETQRFWEPFSDGELTACRKISLRDVGRLGRQSCALRNNRFLQHGFYQFGHLLLCRNCRGQNVLGVPGGYDRQEQYMANMFGFPYFKASGEIRIPGITGGYWYRFIAAGERGR